jgi:hypothetical protein
MLPTSAAEQSGHHPKEAPVDSNCRYHDDHCTLDDLCRDCRADAAAGWFDGR